MFRLDLGKYSTNGGSLSPSLAAILYQTALGDFVYQTDSNGNVVLDNQGTLTSAYDGLPYSGRGIELGALNDVEFPIHHTLGADILDLIAPSVNFDTATTGADGTFTSDTSNNFDLAVTVAGTSSLYPTVETDMTLDITDKTVLIRFDAVINSGTPIITVVFVGGTSEAISQAVVNGENTIEITGTNTNTVARLRFDGTQLFNISVTNWTVKQITNPNSYITYFDFNDGLVTVNNSLNTPSTKYTINTKTINNVITHTTPWSATDWTKINNNPNLIGKLALETLGATKTIPELDMVMDAGASADSYYMCSESDVVGSYLVNARDVQADETITFTSVIFGDEIGTSSNVGNDVHIEVTTVGTLAIRPMVIWNFGTSIDGQLYVTEFDLIVNSGTVDPDINGFNIGSGTGNVDFGNFTTGTYKVSIIEKANGTDGTVRLRLNGTNLFNADINNIKTRKATATEISNYASTVRTNADLQQKGIQTTAFVPDGAGVPQSYSSKFLQFTGDGRYILPNWTPDPTRSFSIEAVIELSDSTRSLYNAYINSEINNTDRVWVWTTNGNQFRYDMGTSSTKQSAILPAGLYHVVSVFDVDTDLCTFYISNVPETPFAVAFTRADLGVAKIGIGELAGREAEYPMGLPIIHEGKALTATEVGTAYAKAKTIYPTIV